MRNIRNCAIWVTLGVLEYFLRPLLTWNKNAQQEREGLCDPARKAAGAVGTSPCRALPVLLPRAPKQPVARFPRASFAKRTQKAVTGRACYRARFCFV